MSRLYTLGYAAVGSDERLGGLMIDESMLLVDVRLRPFSRFRPAYRCGVLEQRFGVRYQHVPQLGNVNYRDHSLPIVLASEEAGVLSVLGWLERGYSVCLLCACSRVALCHRSVVACLVQGRYPCEVIHL